MPAELSQRPLQYVILALLTRDVKMSVEDDWMR